MVVPASMVATAFFSTFGRSFFGISAGLRTIRFPDSLPQRLFQAAVHMVDGARGKTALSRPYHPPSCTLRKAACFRFLILIQMSRSTGLIA